MWSLFKQNVQVKAEVSHSFLLSKFMPFTLDNIGSYITHCSFTPSRTQHNPAWWAGSTGLTETTRGDSHIKLFLNILRFAAGSQQIERITPSQTHYKH